MLVLTEDAFLSCEHTPSRVKIQPSQDLVTVGGRRVLVEADPVGRSIKGCPNLNPLLGIKPCKLTLTLRTGYSEWIRAEGRRVCLDSVTGLTDGTPAGTVNYIVRDPGQKIVSEVT
jgi:hypothetical protein